MRYAFGVDIFGPNIKIGFFNEQGELLDKWKIAAPVLQDGSQILPTIAEELEGYMAERTLFEDDIIGVGVGIPGPVNSSGVVNKCVNLNWGVFNIDRALSGLTGLKVKSGNIANLSALGECWKGSGSQNMAFMAMNTGLGGAVVCDGTLVHGAHGGAGEIGHIIVNRKETEPCTCGRYGCVEQYCSLIGIVRVARRHLAASRTPSVLRNSPFFDYTHIFAAAASGDKVAKEVLKEVYDYAGLALATLCCVTNPDTVVLGGEFFRLGQSALDAIKKAFNKYVFHANANVRFVLAELGTDACIYGAARMVLEDLPE